MADAITLNYLNSIFPINNNAGFTSNGGIFKRLINDTGANSVTGTIVVISTQVTYGVSIAPPDSTEAIGVIYETGIPNGQPVSVVFAGTISVLVKNNTVINRGDWVGVSSVAGRLYPRTGGETGSARYKMVGHALESKTACTNIVCNVLLNFM